MQVANSLPAGASFVVGATDFIPAGVDGGRVFADVPFAVNHTLTLAFYSPVVRRLISFP